MQGAVSNTRVIVIDDVRSTRREYFSPQSPKEVLHNNLDVARAVHWADRLAYHEWEAANPEVGAVLDAAPALGLSIRHDANTVIVRWFAAGDPDQARHELAHVQREGGAL